MRADCQFRDHFVLGQAAHVGQNYVPGRPKVGNVHTRFILLKAKQSPNLQSHSAVLFRVSPTSSSGLPSVSQK
jgi:hypothetical protein